MSDKRFILWDESSGLLPRNSEGEIMTSGLVGQITADNVYLRTYGKRPEGSPGYDSLDVGGVVNDVAFNLSGSTGRYSVYRVR